MWQGIHGHDQIVEQFRRALRRGRLASSFLFAGPAGVGKRTFALKLAAALLCDNRAEEDLDPCGECPACVQVAAGTHPDVEIVAKPEVAAKMQGLGLAYTPNTPAEFTAFQTAEQAKWAKIIADGKLKPQ